jgi:hypothetical protein
MGQGRPLNLVTDIARALVAAFAPMGGRALDGRIGGFVAWDANVAWNPAVFDADALPADESLAGEGPECDRLSRVFIVVSKSGEGCLGVGEDDAA